MPTGDSARRGCLPHPADLMSARIAQRRGHQMKPPKILAVGGAHIDRRGQMTSPFVPGASIPGTMREDVGGGAFNALRNAVGRGAAGALLSLRGGDAAGDAVARAIAQAGILDLSAVFLDRATPSYTALLDSEGDVGGGAGRHGALRDRFPQTAQAREGARGDRGRRRSALRRQHPGPGLAAAGGARRRQAGLRNRDLTGQGSAAGRDTASPLLPPHEPTRGGGAHRHGGRRSRRGHHRPTEGPRPCPRGHHRRATGRWSGSTPPA